MINIKIGATIISLMIFTAACSVIKNPHSSNFQRVKYNAHLKSKKAQGKEQMTSTVSSFEKEIREPDPAKTMLAQTNVSSSKLEKLRSADFHKFYSDLKSDQRIGSKIKLDQLFDEKVNLHSRSNLLNADKFDDGWWNEDPEDWPWLEIALAFIAFLLVCILVILFVDLVGGLIGGILGLILLVALAYLLYIWWV